MEIEKLDLLKVYNECKKVKELDAKLFAHIEIKINKIIEFCNEQQKRNDYNDL